MMNDNKNSTRNCASSAATRRIITVQASGEVACKPDLFSFAICVTSTKENVETAQNSVKRRIEYILQVLRNNGIKERRVERSTDVNRASESEVCVRVNLQVESESLQACEVSRNLLVEKMDATVQCSIIELLHSPSHKAEMRRQAFKQAVAGAKEKAQSVAQMLEFRLGPALEVVEKCPNHDADGTASSSLCSGDLKQSLVTHTDQPTSENLHERLRNSTEVYTTHVKVTFEVSPFRKCYHRKCPKH